MILDEDGREEFDPLQNRLHPAESRVKMLRRRRRRVFRAFDLLASDRSKLTGKPFAERRDALEKLIERAGRRSPSGSVELTPLATTPKRPSPGCGGRGRDRQGARRALQARQRKGMVKVKRVRTIDTVIVGWRPGKEKGTVGSLILGLYEDGKLRPSATPRG